MIVAYECQGIVQFGHDQASYLRPARLALVRLIRRNAIPLKPTKLPYQRPITETLEFPVETVFSIDRDPGGNVIEFHQPKMS